MMSLRSVTVALVTDQPSVARARERALQAGGAEVRNCASPHELVRLLTTEVVDAVVVAEMGSRPAMEAILGALRQELRAQMLPTLVVAPREARVGDLAAPGELVSVIDAAAPDVALILAVTRLLGPFARESESVRERQALNEELAHRTAAAEAVRKATSVVVHDAGVFLGIVVGFACNLRDALAGPLTAAQSEHVHRIVDAATSTAKLLSTHATSELFEPEIWTGPRAAATTRFGRRMLVDLRVLAEQVVMLLSGTAHQAEVGLTLSPGDQLHVWGDALQLKQVTLNLVSNALKFTPRGGRVDVAVRRAHLTPAEGDDSLSARRRVELVVSDTGPGIPALDRERVFGHGVRLVRDAGIPGSGIGLSVVRELVALHEGTVRVDDVPGGGAMFVVALPIDRRQRDERGHTGSRPPSAYPGPGSP